MKAAPTRSATRSIYVRSRAVFGDDVHGGVSRTDLAACRCEKGVEGWMLSIAALLEDTDSVDDSQGSIQRRRHHERSAQRRHRLLRGIDAHDDPGSAHHGDASAHLRMALRATAPLMSCGQVGPSRPDHDRRVRSAGPEQGQTG